MSGPTGTTTQGPSSGLRAMMKVAGTMHRWLYRLSGGKIGGTMGGNPVLLLTTTGRKTGQRRIWPVTYLPDGEDLIVVASAGGQPQQPAWCLNLQANPRVTVQVGNQMRRLVAHTAEGEERGRLWARFIQAYPAFEGYQRKTRRELPVVVLRPETATTGQRAAMP